VTHWLAVFFDWPEGSVWSNLVASALTAAGLWFRAKAKLAQVRAEERATTDQTLAEHRAAVAQQLADHHQAVLAAVSPKETP
jgi:Na+/alanine symporter